MNFYSFVTAHIIGLLSYVIMTYYYSFSPKIYHKGVDVPKKDNPARMEPLSNLSKTRADGSFDGIYDTPYSRRTSLRSIKSLEGSTGNRTLPAFEYEFKKKPYASFNSYSIIPPIQNKNSNTQTSSSGNKYNDKSVEMLLEQELNTHSKKHTGMITKIKQITK